MRTAWSYVEPSAANIKEIREHVEAIQRDMHRIGMQPLSHTVELARGFYRVGGMAGEDVGSFRTFAAATAAGFSASKAMLDHGQD